MIDSTSIFIRGGSLSEIALSMNSEMKNVTEWLRNNMLTLNVTKTNYMIMTTQGKRCNNDECKIIIDESIIDCVSDTKFLGIMLDDKLTWKLHINHICNKVAKAIRPWARYDLRAPPPHILANLYFFEPLGCPEYEIEL